MSRRDPERLQDILDAIDAIRSYVARGDLSDGLIFDAVRVRLIEIGEAIKAVSTELLDTEPTHPWSDIARMRDRLAHRYFDTNHGHVTGLSNTTWSRSKPRCCDSRTNFVAVSSDACANNDEGKFLAVSRAD